MLQEAAGDSSLGNLLTCSPNYEALNSLAEARCHRRPQMEYGLNCGSSCFLRGGCLHLSQALISRQNPKLLEPSQCARMNSRWMVTQLHALWPAHSKTSSLSKVTCFSTCGDYRPKNSIGRRRSVRSLPFSQSLRMLNIPWGQGPIRQRSRSVYITLISASATSSWMTNFTSAACLTGSSQSQSHNSSSYLRYGSLVLTLC